MRWSTVARAMVLAFLGGLLSCARPSEDPDPQRTLALATILQCEAGRWEGPQGYLPNLFLDQGQRVELRCRAALAMGRIGLPMFISPLGEGLSSTNVQVRAMSLFALGEIIDKENARLQHLQVGEEIVGKIRACLRDPAAEVRARAIEALGKTGQKEFLSTLPDLAPDPAWPDDKPHRLYAREWMKAAFRLGHTGCVAPLIRQLGGQERLTALIALARLANTAKVELPVPPATMEELWRNPDQDIRAGAALLATLLAQPPPQTRLAALLADPAHSVRINTLRSLGRAKAPETAAILVSFIDGRLKGGAQPDDSQTAVIAEEIETAVTTLGQFHTTEAGNNLERWMRQYNWLAPFCAEALTAQAPETPLPYDPPLLTNQAQVMRWVQAVSRNRHPDSVKFLERLERGELPAAWRKEWVAAARPAYLGTLFDAKTPAALELVRQSLDSPDPYIRTAATEWIGKLPEAEATPLLAALRASVEKYPTPDTIDPLVAAIPLLKHLGVDGRPVLEKMLTSQNYPVRLQAAGTLAELGDPAPFDKIRPMPARSLDYYANIVRRWDSPTTVTVATTKGTFVIKPFLEEAPLTCASFLQLANQKFYDGLSFHRVVPNFVIQAGCPLGSGNGGPGYTLPCEINPVPYQAGAVGMALSGKDTGGSQFFVTLAEQPHLEGGYTVFGQVIGGIEVVNRITEGDQIRSIQIEWWDFSKYE